MDLNGIAYPQETKKHAAAPATVSQARAPPSGNEAGSAQGLYGALAGST